MVGKNQSVEEVPISDQNSLSEEWQPKKKPKKKNKKTRTIRKVKTLYQNHFRKKQKKD